MAENDVGGIGVKFTAEAAQLKEELTNLERRLKDFNSAHGQTRVKLQAQLVMPGARALQDFRREIEKGFTTQGSAGRIKARIELIPPTAAEIKTLTGSIGDVKVKVVGNFEWGKAPPKTVTVKVIEEGGATAPAGAAPAAGRQPIAVAPATARAASTRASRTRQRSAVVENVTWTRADMDRMSLDALRDQVRGTRGAEKAQLTAEIARREREGLTNLGGYSAGGYKASQPGGGGARGLTGGMTGVYGRGAPQVAHWSQGSVPYQSVLGGRSIDALGRRGQINLPMRDIYNPYPQKGAPKPPEWKPGDLGSAPQLSEAALTRRLRQIARRMTPEAMQAGQGWYQRAGEIAQGLGAGTGLGRAQISGATATFSQNAGWSENVRNAQDFFEAFRRGARTVAEVERHVATIRKDLSFNALGLEGRTQMALKAAMAESPRGVEEAISGPKLDRSPKIRAFHRALMGDPTSFTVDRHMAMMMSGGTIGSAQKMHTPFQKAGQRVAGEMGVSAADLQAMLWTLALGPEFAGADPYGQMRAGGPGGIPGGARGFAAPAWLKNKPDRSRMAMLDVVMDQVKAKGRPGIHVEQGGQLGIRGQQGDPRRMMYSVARNEEGTPLGALAMFLKGQGHDVDDIMPFVDPGSRGMGIGKGLYAHAERSGFGVEAVSDLNASAKGRQTALGEALWLSRKRQMGVDPQEAINRAAATIGRGPLAVTGGARGIGPAAETIRTARTSSARTAARCGRLTRSRLRPARRLIVLEPTRSRGSGPRSAPTSRLSRPRCATSSCERSGSASRSDRADRFPLVCPCRHGRLRLPRLRAGLAHALLSPRGSSGSGSSGRRDCSGGRSTEFPSVVVLRQAVAPRRCLRSLASSRAPRLLSFGRRCQAPSPLSPASRGSARVA